MAYSPKDFNIETKNTLAKEYAKKKLGILDDPIDALADVKPEIKAPPVVPQPSPFRLESRPELQEIDTPQGKRVVDVGYKQQPLPEPKLFDTKVADEAVANEITRKELEKVNPNAQPPTAWEKFKYKAPIIKDPEGGGELDVGYVMDAGENLRNASKTAGAAVYKNIASLARTAQGIGNKIEDAAIGVSKISPPNVKVGSEPSIGERPKTELEQVADRSDYISSEIKKDNALWEATHPKEAKVAEFGTDLLTGLVTVQGASKLAGGFTKGLALLNAAEKASQPNATFQDVKEAAATGALAGQALKVAGPTRVMQGVAMGAPVALEKYAEGKDFISAVTDPDTLTNAGVGFLMGRGMIPETVKAPIRTAKQFEYARRKAVLGGEPVGGEQLLSDPTVGEIVKGYGGMIKNSIKDIFKTEPKKTPTKYAMPEVTPQISAPAKGSVTEPPQKSTSEVLYHKIGNNNIEIIKNPSPSDYRQIDIEFKKEFPNAKQEPSTRTTYDSDGNKYIWRSDRAVHSDVEPFIINKFGVEANQNKYFSQPPKKSVGAAGQDNISDAIPLRQLPQEPLKVKTEAGEKVTITPKPGEAFSVTPFQTAEGKIKYELHDGDSYIIPKNTAQDLTNRFGMKPLDISLPKDLEVVRKGANSQIEVKKGQRGWQVFMNGKLKGTILKPELTEEQALQIAHENAGQHFIGQSATKYSQYTLPEGKNYREVLLKAPNRNLKYTMREDAHSYTAYDENGKKLSSVGKGVVNNRLEAQKYMQSYLESQRPDQFKSSHWDEPNVVAHTRLAEHTTKPKYVGTHRQIGEELFGDNAPFDNRPEEQRRAIRQELDKRWDTSTSQTTLLEEIQSDWAAKGRKDKFINEEPPEGFDVWKEADGKWYVGSKNTGATMRDGVGKTREEAIKNAWNTPMFKGSGTPYHPALKDWQTHTLKQAIKEAVDAGSDSLSWVTGEQTADRYDLSKQVGMVYYFPKTNKLTIVPINGEVINEYSPPAKLADYIGKDAAKKLLETPLTKEGMMGDLAHRLDGPNLKVGGEWASNLYDKQIPNILKDLTKGYNTKFQDITLENGKTVHSMTITPELREAISGDKGTVGAMSKGARADKASLEEEAKKYKSAEEFIKSHGKPLYHGSENDFEKFSYEFLGKQGTTEGKGFYFTDNKSIAEHYMHGEGGKLFEVYVDVKKPLNFTGKDITFPQLKKFIKALDKDDRLHYEGAGYLDNWGEIKHDGYENVLNRAAQAEYNGSDNDVDMIHSIINADGGNPENVYPVLKKTLGYDGIRVKPDWGDGQTITIAFNPEQIKTRAELTDIWNKAHEDQPTFKEGDVGIGENITGSEAAEEYLKIAKRLKLSNAEIALVKTIASENGPMLAVSVGKGAAFTDVVSQFAGQHEMVHTIYKNLKDLKLFKDKGITQKGLDKEITAKYGPQKDNIEIQERLATGFEEYVKERLADKKTSAKGRVKIFFDKIWNWLKNLVRPVNRPMIDEFYDLVQTGKAKVATELKGKSIESFISPDRTMDFKAKKGQTFLKPTVATTEEPIPQVRPEPEPKTPLIAQAGSQAGVPPVSERLSYNPDKINGPADVEKLIKEVSARSGEFREQRPVKASQEEIERLAQLVGINPLDLLKVKAGSIANAETVFKSRQIVVDLAKDLSDYVKTIDTATASPQELKVYRDKLFRLQGTMKTVAGFRTEASNLFRQFQYEVSPQEDQTIRDMLAEVKKIDQAAAGNLEMFTTKTKELVEPTTADKLWHLWYASILSGPTTHLKNIIGNVSQLMIELPRTLVTSPDQFPSAIVGMINSFTPSLWASGRVFRDGALAKFEGTGRKPIVFTGKFTRILNAADYVGRTLEAVDTFFKGVTSGMELEQLAYSKAKSEGLRGKDLKAQTRFYTQNPTPEMLAGVDEYKRYMTYQQKPEGFLGALASGLGKVAGKYTRLKPIVPFTNVVSNVVNNAIDWTPWGLVRVSRDKWRQKKGKESWSDRRRGQALGRAILGTLAMAGFASLAVTDKMTGRGPTDYRKREQLRASGWREDSFVFTDKDGNKTYIPFTYYLGPLALGASIAANYHDAMKYDGLSEKDALDRVSVAVLGSANLILNMSFLSGASELLTAVTQYDIFGPSYLKRVLAQQSTSVVPNLYKQVSRYFDPNVYAPETIRESILNSMRITDGLRPKIDVFGDPVVGEKLTKLQPSHQKKDDIKTFLAEQNLWISVPSKNTTILDYSADKKVEMTPKQYYDYVLKSGRNIKKELEASRDIINSIEDHQEKQDYIDEIVNTERKYAKQDVEDGL